MENNQHSKEYDKGYQEGYMAAKKADEAIILRLQKTLTILQDELQEMREEYAVRYRY